jgi:hypothetical protein
VAKKKMPQPTHYNVTGSEAEKPNLTPNVGTVPPVHMPLVDPPKKK